MTALAPRSGVASVGPLDLHYETFGDPTAPTLLLVMGLGAQLLAWDAALCRRFVGAGFHVVRYDHRDIGLSTYLDDFPPDPVSHTVRYSLDDLADDAVGLLNALGVDVAHVAGASMGAMVSQLMVLRHRSRVRSLASIMGTTGDPSVGGSRPEATAALLAPAPGPGDAGVVDGLIALQHVLASPAFPLTDRQRRSFAERSFRRAHHPAGALRQLSAVMAAPDRTARLSDLDVPTVVIHGDADPLIDVSGGRATADAIPGARLVVIEGMGHDLPAAIWPNLVEEITANASRA